MNKRTGIQLRLFQLLLHNGMSLSWPSVIWGVNGFFLLMTVVVTSLPGRGSPDRHGLVQYLAQFTLAEERNLATYWEGWCLLLVSILAVERYLNSGNSAIAQNKAWLGLSLLAAGLSLDELGSVHERAPLLFSTWGFSGKIESNIPFAIPVLFLLFFTLRRMWRLSDRRHFWLILSAFILFGSVPYQEYLEYKIAWPWWAQGIRAGIEEGTELVGVFLLMSVVASGARKAKSTQSIASLVPNITTLVSLKGTVAFFTLVGFIPLGILTSLAMDNLVARGTPTAWHGTPAAWLPFVLLNLVWMVTSGRGELDQGSKKWFLFISLLGFLFSLDQILVFERVIDKYLLRGDIESLMFPCMAAFCMAIPTLRTRFNFILIGALLPLSILLIVPSPQLVVWLVIPLQCLGIFSISVSGLTVPINRTSRPTLWERPFWHGARTTLRLRGQ